MSIRSKNKVAVLGKRMATKACFMHSFSIRLPAIDQEFEIEFLDADVEVFDLHSGKFTTAGFQTASFLYDPRQTRQSSFSQSNQDHSPTHSDFYLLNSIATFRGEIGQASIFRGGPKN